MEFDIAKLYKNVDTWSQNMGEEKILIHVPDNSKKERNHLGMSQIGDECGRKSWYSFRKMKEPTFPGRVKRLFQRGHREEFFMVHMLTRVGLTVKDIDPKTGKQFKVSDFEGHLSGSMDGLAKDLSHIYTNTNQAFLLEFKTYNDKRFTALLKDGVAVSDPKYYVQIQGYLGYRPSLGGCLFIAINKNDDNVYFEWVDFDEKMFRRIKSKAEMIINATEPPKRIAEKRGFFKCRFCDYEAMCFRKEEPLKTCKTCKFGEPGTNSTWECVRGKEFGNVCEEYTNINEA